MASIICDLWNYLFSVEDWVQGELPLWSSGEGSRFPQQRSPVQWFNPWLEKSVCCSGQQGEEPVSANHLLHPWNSSKIVDYLCSLSEGIEFELGALVNHSKGRRKDPTLTKYTLILNLLHFCCFKKKITFRTFYHREWVNTYNFRFVSSIIIVSKGRVGVCLCVAHIPM